jgi:hypothetical protein
VAATFTFNFLTENIMKALDTLLNTIAEKLGMGDDGAGLLAALKATAFKPAKVSGQLVTPTDSQIMALLVVANQYGLNPWLKEIYAFPDKFGGIVPVVGVDGWSRIINTHPQYDGVDFEQDENMCTCTIHRKDRNHPTRITEYMVECRGTQGAWLTHPYRFLRHKALIQCARLAFGFGGIYEQDEAERIIDAVDADTGEVIQVTQAKPRRASEVAKAALPTPTDPEVIVPVVRQAEDKEPVAILPPEAPQEAHQHASEEPAGKVPASEGECLHIIKIAKAKGVDLAELLRSWNSKLDPNTLAGMTKKQYAGLKGAL